MKTMENNGALDEFWSIAGVCDALGVSYTTLYRWRYHMEGMNFPDPVYNINNRKIMFSKKDVME
ncbi:helix-turn-helix transcriptional regulator [Desulfobacter vibrioformis]|uniref:helix-turn-helix transcriptional regulator n=1 Tax=Desulfobacter vibrioformis TaxID=34031 RepID=UPI0005520338|nr:helix-turn-helix domain-containing protein [Desulfobacter vibrioformis]